MELIVIIAALLTATAIAALSKRRVLIEATAVAATIITMFASSLIASKVLAGGAYAPIPFFNIDSLGVIILLIIATVGLAAAIYSVQYLRQESAKKIVDLAKVKLYFSLFGLFLAVMVLAVTAASPIMAWIAVEATTLSTALLISFYNKPSSAEAAWKYLIVNSVGLLLGFFGAVLFFTAVGSAETGFISWQSLLAGSGRLNPLIVKIAFIFVLIGYGTKAGLAPMHTWLPDAHSKAPAPISALLSGVLLNVALLMVLRFKVITDAAIGPSFSQNLLIIFGLLSIFIAALIILNQKNYKRLLAYSSIENMGIMALGFGFGGLGVLAAILHMIYHALLKSALFMSAGTIFLRFESTKIAKVRGVLKALPMTGVLFLIGFLAITGTPPFGSFLTKMAIINAGMRNHPLAAITALILIAILFIGFLKQVTAMMLSRKPEEIKVGRENFWLIISPLCLILTVAVLSFYLPSFLSELIAKAASLY